MACAECAVSSRVQPVHSAKPVTRDRTKPADIGLVCSTKLRLRSETPSRDRASDASRNLNSEVQPFWRSDNVQARPASRARGQIPLQVERWERAWSARPLFAARKLVCEAAFAFRERLRRSAAPFYLCVPLPAKLTSRVGLFWRLRFAGRLTPHGCDPLRPHSRREDLFIGGVEQIGRGAQARLFTRCRARPV